MQVLKCAQPWSRDELVVMLDYDLQMLKCGSGALFALLLGIFEKVRRMWLLPVVLETQYFAVCALAKILRLAPIYWSRFDVVSSYPFSFTTKNV